MIKHLFLLSCSLFVFANDIDKFGLLDDLENISEIATRSNLNIEKTPAVVTVLHAKDLEKLGVVNLYEALGYVPGIELSMGDGGAKQIIMRGNKGSLRDKLKLMIDGVSVNNELAGSNYFYLDMPLGVIEKIEIIRGPASALYGSFAHIGVINVITKSSLQNSTNLFTNISSEGYKNLGFVQNVAGTDYKLLLNGYIIKNNNSRPYSNYSLIPGAQTYYSYEDFTNQSLGIQLQLYKDIKFSSRILQNDTENFFGYGSWPIASDPKRVKQRSFINEINYTPKLSQNFSLDLKAGYKHYTFEGESRFVPYSLLGTPYDLVVKGHYKEDVLYGDAALKYNTQKHSFLLGVYGAKARELSTGYYKNDTNSSTVNIPDPAISSGIKQEQLAFYISDLYAISETLSTNIALRYDRFSLTKNGFAPKIAFMYNPNENHTYKLLYQRSFRVPSWLELYGLNEPFIGNRNINAETIDTIEFVYRYQTALHTYLNFNLYYNTLHNLITQEGASEFTNAQDIHSYGFELEMKKAISDHTTVQANYSYINMNYDDNTDVGLIANNLGHLMLTHRFNAHLSSGTALNMVGKRKRQALDTRGDLKGYTTLNQTLTYKYKTLSVQGSVKNIF
ncbi:MAG: TonB-dependent receptor, partial [Sulfurimonas sp.]